MKKAYRECKKQLELPKEEQINAVQSLYNEYPYETISRKIAEIVTPSNIQFPVDVIYQSVEDLRDACPNNNGDWYFSGNYPTPGGTQVVNRSFVNYMEGNNERAY